MPWLHPDDDVRRLDAVWVQMTPQARFVSWAVWLVASMLAFPLLGFVVPVGVLVAGVAWVGYRFGAARVGRKYGAVFAGSGLVLVLLTVPFPLLLRPLFWPVAIPVAAVAGAGVTRWVARWVRYETPLRYWWAALQGEVGSPRGRRAVRYSVKG